MSPSPSKLSSRSPFSTLIPLFIETFSSLPADTADVLPLLLPFLRAEGTLCRAFVQNHGRTMGEDPYVGLLDLFAAPQKLRQTICRLPPFFQSLSDEHYLDLYQSYHEGGWALQMKPVKQFFDHHIFSLPPSVRRHTGSPSTTENIYTFQDHWDAFTFGLLKHMDWTNVVAAGGSVQACLLPIEVEDLGHFYHETSTYSKSGIDLFLWGLNEDQGKQKMDEIFYAIKAAVRWDIICIRSRRAVSIHTRFPFRTVNIFLRLYSSPSEVLAGIDIDCACVAYDGCRVFANPRAVVAMMTQCNSVDITCRSPSYEIRLRKYADRGFEVYEPTLSRLRVNHHIYSITPGFLPRGLARLLILEDMRYSRMRVDWFDFLSEPLSTPIGEEDSGLANLLDPSDDDPSLFRVPYGPTWTTSRIREFCIASERKFSNCGDARQEEKTLYCNDEAIDSLCEAARQHRHLIFCADSMSDCLKGVCYLKSCFLATDSPSKTYADDLYLTPGPIRLFSCNGRPTRAADYTAEVERWQQDAYTNMGYPFFD